MSFIGFAVALWLFFHFKAKIGRQLVRKLGESGKRADDWNACGPWDWDPYARRRRHRHRGNGRQGEGSVRLDGAPPAPPSEAEIRRRAQRRAGAELGFYWHLTVYGAVIAGLAFINMMTSPFTPWFIWPAFGWGIGIFFHWMGVYGSRMLKEQVFDPAVEREVRREKAAMTSEKQASIGELSSTIAHEIRNPIAAAKSLVQQIGEDPASPENVEYGKVALEELERVERSISHLLKYAKEEDYRFERVNLANVVDSSLTQLRSKLDDAKVAVARNYISGPTIVGDGDKLRQVFGNILSNAIDAMQTVAEARRIELYVENGRPDHATVRIRDNGAGIAPEKLEKIFNPFFTTKDDGTGLGLAISKKIVEAHEGAIEATSEPGRGTEFRVFLPLAPKGA